MVADGFTDLSILTKYGIARSKGSFARQDIIPLRISHLHIDPPEADCQLRLFIASADPFQAMPRAFHSLQAATVHISHPFSDLKPSNIFVISMTGDRQSSPRQIGVKIVDFGLAVAEDGIEGAAMWPPAVATDSFGPSPSFSSTAFSRMPSSTSFFDPSGLNRSTSSSLHTSGRYLLIRQVDRYASAHLFFFRFVVGYFTFYNFTFYNLLCPFS